MREGKGHRPCPAPLHMAGYDPLKQAIVQTILHCTSAPRNTNLETAAGLPRRSAPLFVQGYLAHKKRPPPRTLQ